MFSNTAVDSGTKETIGGVIVGFIVIAIVYTIGTVVYNFKKSRRHESAEVEFATEVETQESKTFESCRPKLIDNHQTQLSMQTTVVVRLVTGYDEGLTCRQRQIVIEITKSYLNDVYAIVHDDDLDEEEEQVLRENAAFMDKLNKTSKNL